MAKIPLDSFQLQFISHQNEKMTYLDGIREALAGGCKWIQLRMKGATDEEVRPIAQKVKEWCKEQNATFLIDDRVQLVKELQIDGVHLGKNDMPIAEARKILGDDFIIGGTANTFEDIKRLEPIISVAVRSASLPLRRSSRLSSVLKAIAKSSRR